jgi:hypothetical protein
MAQLSPGGSGQLTDPDGRQWTVRRRRLDLRIVRRLLRRTDLPALLGESGGFQLRWLSTDDRPRIWEHIRHRYAGPGGLSNHATDYTGYEFTAEDGGRLLYIEERC